MRLTDISLGVGDTGLASGRLDTFDIFLYLGSKLESEFEWRNALGTTYNINNKYIMMFLQSNISRYMVLYFNENHPKPTFLCIAKTYASIN